jgi:hypothetical protein
MLVIAFASLQTRGFKMDKHRALYLKRLDYRTMISNYKGLISPENDRFMAIIDRRFDTSYKISGLSIIML